MDGQLIAAFLGAAITAAGGFGVVLFNEELRRRNAAKAELRSYLAALVSTKSEILFYHGILTKMSGDVADMVQRTKVGEPRLIIPTYDCYPAFLEQCKLSLGRFLREPEIVKRVGSCHFELSHIRQRLAVLKEVHQEKEFVTIGQTDPPQPIIPPDRHAEEFFQQAKARSEAFFQQARANVAAGQLGMLERRIINLEGFKGLIDLNIESFADCGKAISDEVSLIEREIKEIESHYPTLRSSA